MRHRLAPIAAALLVASCLDARLELTDGRTGAIGNCTHLGAGLPGVAQSGGSVYVLVWKGGVGSQLEYQLEALRPGGAVDLLGTAHHFALAGDRLYLAGQDDAATQDLIVSIPVAGGAPTVLGSAALWGVSALAVDGSAVYLALQGAAIWAAPITGGPGTSIATGMNGVRWLASDGTNLFFLGSDGLFRVPVTGGTPVALLTGDDRYVQWNAVLGDSDVFLWSGGGIWRVPKGSAGAPLGAPFLVAAPIRDATAPPYLSDVVYDGSELVFSAHQTGFWVAWVVASVSLATREERVLAIEPDDPLRSRRTGTLAATPSIVYVWDAYNGDLCEVPR